jgi:replicative DNA helicase
MHTSNEESQPLVQLRVPPHSIESECSLLGALLLNNDAQGLIVSLVKSAWFKLG